MSGSLLSFGRVVQVALAAASVAVAPALAAPLHAASGPGCLTVAVAEPIELPNGSVYPAGDLSLCIGQPLSPVTALQRVSVGGIPIGILLSNRGMSEGPASAEPSVLFRRVASGRLHLVGYAWPAGTRNRTYLLRDPAEFARGHRDVVLAAREPIEPAVEVPAPLLAARLN